MKKSKVKKSLAVALSITMVMNMAACSKKETKENETNIDTGTLSAEESAKISKEHVFRENIISLPDELSKQDTYISGVDISGDTLRILSNSYTWIEPDPDNPEDYGSGSYEYSLYKANLDGSNSSFVTLNTQMEDAQNSWLSNSFFSKDKERVYCVFNINHYNPETEYYTSSYELYCYDMQGEQLFNTELFQNDDSVWMECRTGYVNQDGDVVIIAVGDTSKVIKVSPEGEVKENKTLDSDIWKNFSGIVVDKNQKVYVTAYTDDWQDLNLHEMNMDTGAAINTYKLPRSVAYNGGTPYSLNENGDFVFIGQTSIVKYHLGDEDTTEFMNFINSDLNYNGFNYIFMIDEQNFYGVYNSADDYKPVLSKFTYVDPKDIPDTKTLVLGCNYLNWNTKKDVIKFNKNNGQYRIVVKDYNSYGDYEAAMTAFNNDIVGGKMPDILILSDDTRLRNYASKGILADIKKLIAEDPELSKNEYLENVFNAYTSNDIQYALPYNFYIRTMIAKESLVGNPTTFTFEDAKNALTKMEDGATIFRDMLRNDFLYQAISFSGNSLIDMEKGECHFDSQTFIDILEYAKTLPTEFPEDYWNDSMMWDDYYKTYRENTTLLYPLYIDSFNGLIEPMKATMGEPVSFVGFPGGDGKGAMLAASSTPIAISSKSENIEGAWQFVRQYITEEYQYSGNNGKYDTDMYAFPVLKSAFEDKAMQATEKPYWLDENGNKQEYDYTSWVNGEELILDPFTKQEVQEIMEYIYSINTTAFYNENIYKVIEEEAEAYFSDQKQAQDVAAIIQNRLSIMISEGM